MCFHREKTECSTADEGRLQTNPSTNSSLESHLGYSSVVPLLIYASFKTLIASETIELAAEPTTYLEQLEADDIKQCPHSLQMDALCLDLVPVRLLNT